MMPNQGFGELDRFRHRSPSPMTSPNLMSNVGGTGLGGWSGLAQEVISIVILYLTSCPLALCCIFLLLTGPSLYSLSVTYTRGAHIQEEHQ